MKVFITGASGFLGRAVGDRLREQGDEVTGVDVRADPAGGVVAGDISVPGAWQGAAAGADMVVHTAAIVSNAVGLDAQWRTNVLGTKHVLDAAEGASRCVVLSSIRAFSDLGFPDGVTEDHPVRMDGNPYVDTKVAAEQVAFQAHASGRAVVTVIRPGDVYGPGSRPWTLMPLELIRSGRFALPARGLGVFSPVYVDDLVDGLLLAAASPEGAGQVFTLTGGVGVTCKDFFGHYYRMLGKRGPTVLPTGLAVAASVAVSGAAALARRETEVNATSLRYFTRTGTYSIEKARRVLGYAPQVDLEEGMRRTRAWLVEQGLVTR